MKQHYRRLVKSRKFLLILPLFLLPVAALLFWTLGGSPQVNRNEGTNSNDVGLNMDLPDAHLEEATPLDKLSYYEKAASDSETVDNPFNDPSKYLQFGLSDSAAKLSELDSEWLGKKDPIGLGRINRSEGALANIGLYTDSNEAKVYNKLTELNRALSQASLSQQKGSGSERTENALPQNKYHEELKRLEQVMDRGKASKGVEDPEIRQLNSMMDKILDIQHPERIKKEPTEIVGDIREQTFAVNARSDYTPASLMVGEKASSYSGNRRSAIIDLEVQNRFYSLDDSTAEKGEERTAINALVHETKTLVDGSIVKLRLADDIVVNEVRIPKDNFVFGTATLNGDRLNIEINNIRYKNNLFPVRLTVFDLDGIRGIYIPGTISRDVAKQSADRAVQAIALSSIDPSLKAQAATAGIEAAKSMLTKKAKQVKFTLKAGYQVILLDERIKTSS